MKDDSTYSKMGGFSDAEKETVRGSIVRDLVGRARGEEESEAQVEDDGPEENLEDPSHSEEDDVEWDAEEDVPDDEAPEEDGQPEDAEGSEAEQAEEQPTEDAGPDSDEEQPARTYAGKFKSADELEKAYSSTEQRMHQALQEAAALRSQLTELQSRQTQQIVPFEKLPSAERERYEAEADEWGTDPRELYISDLRQQRREHSRHRAQIEADRSAALQRVDAWTQEQKFTPEKEQFIAKQLKANNGLHVLGQMPPQQMESFMVNFISQLSELADLRQSQARHDAEKEEARRAGVREARKAKKAKKTARTEASRSMNARPGEPRKQRTVDKLLQRKKEASGW